jgi:hypothetical protein
MAKGSIINQETKEKIVLIYLSNPDWTANKVREKLEETMGNRCPGLSAIQKILQALRNRRESATVLDKPWNLSALDTYPIPYDTLPAVINVWKMRERFRYTGCKINPSTPTIRSLRPLTIRQAKWASRLSYIINDTQELSHYCTEYAEGEKMFELSGLPFDSTDLDRSITKLDVPFDFIIEAQRELPTLEKKDLDFYNKALSPNRKQRR